MLRTQTEGVCLLFCGMPVVASKNLGLVLQRVYPKWL